MGHFKQDYKNALIRLWEAKLKEAGGVTRSK